MYNVPTNVPMGDESMPTRLTWSNPVPYTGADISALLLDDDSFYWCFQGKGSPSKQTVIRHYPDGREIQVVLKQQVTGRGTLVDYGGLPALIAWNEPEGSVAYIQALDGKVKANISIPSELYDRLNTCDETNTIQTERIKNLSYLLDGMLDWEIAVDSALTMHGNLITALDKALSIVLETTVLLTERYDVLAARCDDQSNRIKALEDKLNDTEGSATCPNCAVELLLVRK